MSHKSLLFRILILVFASAPFSLSAQDVDIAEGKTLFQNYCASCHNKNMKDKLTGPALAGTEERWADYPRADLYKWIRNSQVMISEGHPRAVELWNEWKPVVMSPFPNLTDPQVENILAYIDDVVNAAPVVLGPTGGAGAAEQKSDNTWLFVGLFALLAILAVVLARIIANLNYMMELKAGREPERKTLMDILMSRGVIGFLVFALVIIGGFTTVNNAINLGRQQSYAPEQPIKFSHATHSGLHKIDCQYCHDGARRSKQSVIPAANTCMNCHTAIKKGSTYGTAELTKIYASIGFNPNTDTYIDDYESLSESEMEKIYKQWFADQYVQDNEGRMDGDGELLVSRQWSELVSSLTNETKKKIQGPIEWVRIHNLPDHAYFNHAQHVAVGKVECQTCHGQVEKMEVVHQHATLSMGWCVNCHRQTEVQFAGNEYYQSYETYHNQLQEGTRDRVTVEEIGGLECQKCHY
jgi:mono/diheme cytochrome c family protein